MKITIIGAGYVGLSLAMLLSSDNEVTIVDKDEKKIEMINDGVSPLRESDIIKAFAENKDSIIATSSIEEPLKALRKFFCKFITCDINDMIGQHFKICYP